MSMTKSIYLSSRVIIFIVIASPPLFVILSLSKNLTQNDRERDWDCPFAMLLEMTGR
jgi:hypothetical protein